MYQANLLQKIKISINTQNWDEIKIKIPETTVDMIL